MSRYKLVDEDEVVHGYSHNKAKLIRYLNEMYESQNVNVNTLPCQFQIIKVKSHHLNNARIT